MDLFEKRRFWKFVLIVILIIIIGVLGFGIIGENETKKMNATCDIGFKDVLCYKWHIDEVYKIGRT